MGLTADDISKFEVFSGRPNPSLRPMIILTEEKIRLFDYLNCNWGNLADPFKHPRDEDVLAHWRAHHPDSSPTAAAAGTKAVAVTQMSDEGSALECPHKED